MLPDWPRAWGVPPVTAVLRAEPADFYVEEQLGFEPGGSGEHCWLLVEKENLNTVDAARRLATFAGIAERDISYAGLKDRRAVTRQWFSLHLINRAVDWSRWSDPDLRLVTITRHDRKLRRGTHRGNRFRLILREVRGDLPALIERVGLIAARGVPNYFGEQRFGRNGRNLDNARQWVAAGMPRRPRQQTGLMLSSLRSLLFNDVLARRVGEDTWSRAGEGDIFMLEGTASVFTATVDAELQARLVSGDIHLTGPLAGRPGKLQPAGDVAVMEAAVLDAESAAVDALQRAGLHAERRSLRLLPQDLRAGQCAADVWQLDFSLPRGTFATSLVRELADVVPDDSTRAASGERV